VRRVQHLWPHRDDLTRLDVEGGSVVTTEDHPYWNATDHAWEQIGDFDPGDLVLTGEGRLVAVRGLAWGTTHHAAAYNLTVAGIHTYYVLAGHHTVLVHNCGGGSGADKILFHYTDEAGSAGIAKSGVIRAGMKNRVHLTPEMYSEEQAAGSLFINSPDYVGRGSHVVMMTLPDGIELLEGSISNELVTYGSLRPNILYNGPNPF